jgi:hypothetical protein
MSTNSETIPQRSPRNRVSVRVVLGRTPSRYDHHASLIVIDRHCVPTQEKQP